VVGLSRHWHLRSALRPSSLRVEPDRAQALIARGATLVDVRRQEDPSPTFRDAVRVPPDEIPGWIEGMRPEVAIVLACT
jgi:hypothetical protein